jgi:hypothetical protein
MSRNSILGKLRCELAEDITTERQVVYILVEIRKAIEQAGELKNDHALDFHCSFALHTKMDKIGAQRILERFDKGHAMSVNGQQLPRDLQNEIIQTAQLTKFRDQMEAFMTANYLPTRLFTKPDEWVRFVRLYGNVIDECALELKGDAKRLRFIDRVVVSLETAPQLVGTQELFRLCWTCYGKEGKKCDYFVVFGFEAPPKPKKRSKRRGRSKRRRVTTGRPVQELK